MRRIVRETYSRKPVQNLIFSQGTGRLYAHREMGRRTNPRITFPCESGLDHQTMTRDFHFKIVIHFVIVINPFVQDIYFLKIDTATFFNRKIAVWYLEMYVCGYSVIVFQ